MGKKNRFKKVSRELTPGRKLEQSSTMRLDADAQQERFARNQWYRYFVQMEAKYRMVHNDEEILAAQQSLVMLGMPIGVARDSELGKKIEAERQLEQSLEESAQGPVTRKKSRRGKK
ncbi:hypothetical protein CJU89_4124 [Yarrowia sp. B02]|nr:hypothetical protein CJU89_4124 [Yarrowia sp. B02]